jgi:hypothetical protein
MNRYVRVRTTNGAATLHPSLQNISIRTPNQTCCTRRAEKTRGSGETTQGREKRQRIECRQKTKGVGISRV